MSSSADLLTNRLRDHLKPHGRIAEFCRKTALPRNTVKNWLAGTAIPTTALDAIAEAMGTTAMELLRPEGPQPTPARKPSPAEAWAIVGEAIGVTVPEKAAPKPTVTTETLWKEAMKAVEITDSSRRLARVIAHWEEIPEGVQINMVAAMAAAEEADEELPSKSSERKR